MKPIIKAEGVSKQYSIGTAEAARQTLREYLTETAKNPLRPLRKGRQSRSETIWALKDVSFALEPGEVLGFVGSNGAGKSTLLKILSRITEPTTGRIQIYGHVGSLLEVGTGFHPDLTGRENILLNGAILGMKRNDINRKFDEIVAFSEVERFIDTPVKYYSSGMYMRLAFSVAAHLDPEILIVDEVLAVGDSQFQKKCLGKIGEVADAGRTVLFVSHNMVAVQSLCSRVIWLEQGKIRNDGSPKDVIETYTRTSLSTCAEQAWDDPNTAPGNKHVRVKRASVSRVGGVSSEPIDIKTPVVMEFEYWNLSPDAHLNLSVVVSTKDGYPIFNTGSGREPVWHGRPFPAGLFRSTFYIPGDLLNDGTHRVDLYIVRDESDVIYLTKDILVFDVEEVFERRAGWYGKWIGAVRPNLEWRTQLLQKGEAVRQTNGVER